MPTLTRDMRSAFLLEKINMEQLPSIELAATGGEVTTTSLEIARVFERPHKDVINSIRNLNCSEEFNGRNFSPVEYLDKKGESRPSYLLTKTGFTFLALGFTGEKAGKYREAYINEFERMERELRSPMLSKPLHIPPLVEEFESALKLNKLIGFEGNEAILSANKAVRRNNGGADLLSYVQAELVAPTKEQVFTPTQLGAMLDPKRKPTEINLLLKDMGLQTRIVVTSGGKTRKPYILTEEGKHLSKLVDAGKKGGGETSIQQIKWFGSVVDLLKEHIEFEEE